MSEPGSFRHAFPRDSRSILQFAGPLLVNNLVIAGMMLVNTVVAGRLGPEPLAGVAVGGSYYQMFWLFGLGVLMSISPIVAHAYGGGRDEEVGRRFRQGVWLALMLAVPLVAALACVRPLLGWFGTDPRAIPHAVGYVYAMCFGMPAMLVFLAHRYTSEGIGWTRPVIYTAAVGLTTNILGNWVFTLGAFGLPSQGARGCGIATALASWAMLVTMHLYQRRQPVYRRFRLFERFDPPDRRALGDILGLGLPIAGSVVSEGALFAVAALLMSTLGTEIVAAHQVAISYASLMFMIPLSLHSATTIHVGHQVGRGDVRGGLQRRLERHRDVRPGHGAVLARDPCRPAADRRGLHLGPGRAGARGLAAAVRRGLPDPRRPAGGDCRGAARFQGRERPDGPQLHGLLAGRIPGRLVVRYPTGLWPFGDLGRPDCGAGDLRGLPAASVPAGDAPAAGGRCRGVGSAGVGARPLPGAGTVSACRPGWKRRRRRSPPRASRHARPAATSQGRRWAAKASTAGRLSRTARTAFATSTSR